MLQSKPYISVILPVYNQEKYIVETIESVLSQSFKEFEFLIVDDGSTDNSAEIIRQYALRDNRIIAFYEPNSGKSAATNYLVEKARGTWCAFLDADDVMLPERLQKQLDFHHSNAEIAASSVDCYYINETGRMVGTQRYTGVRSVAECKKVMGNKFFTCSFTGLMVSKEAYLDAGGLRTQFEPCEDFEFVNRLVHNKRYILVILSAVLMKYRIHSKSITVRKPFLIFEKTNYVRYCMNLREKGLPEISFNEFMIIQDSVPWWVKFNKKRYDYSRFLFRNAGFSMLSKKYFLFVGQIGVASLLSPIYVLHKLKNLVKK